MKLFGSITELVSAVFRKDSQLITLRPSGSVAYTQNRVIDLPPEDASSSLVSATSTQTLTNKSLSGDNNTLSNIGISSLKTVLADANKAVLRDASGAVVSASIVNANIDAAAAIALTKLATVTASRALQSDGSGNISASSITSTELGHLSGVSSNIQNQLNAKADTSALTAHTSASSGVHGTTSAVVGLTDSQTLQNKTIDTANNTVKIAGTSITAVTGSGSVVLATSPSLTTPVLGVASATSINKLAITAPASGATLALADGSTLATSGAFSTTLTATGATNVTLPTSGTLARLADITTTQITGTLAASKGGTGVSNNDAATLTRTGNFDLNVTTTAPSAVTMPTSGTLATLAGTEQLTNKDIAGGTASNTSRITLPSAAKSTLDGLTRKQATLVYGTDTNKVYADDGSALKEIGSGSSGINYLSAQYGADALGTVQTSVGDVLASSTRSNPTQWGNSAASALITQSTDSTLRGTTNYLVAYTANAQFVESPLFSIDGEDLGKPLLVQFDVSGVGTADDVQVYIARYNSSNVLQERILVAGTASATTPNSAQVPTAVTTFRGFFIPSSTSTDKYAVRWLRNANNTSMRLDTFFVGPQSLAQGAVVTAWQSYTPTFGAGMTIASPEVFWRRIGDSLQIIGRINVSTVSATQLNMSFPDTLLTAKLIAGDTFISGFYTRANAAANTYKRGVLIAQDGFTGFRLSLDDYTASTNPLVGQTGSGLFNAGEVVSFNATVQISQWSSGTTTLADRAVEEYVSHNGTLQVTGPDGAAIPTSTPAGTSESYVITTQSSILSTDTFILEMQRGGVGGWFRSNDRIDQLRFDGTNFIGAGVYFDGTNLQLIRGKYKSGVTSAWSGLSGDKWRVRKVSSGAAVGFPVSARNIVGDTSGSVVPAGYIGEQLSQSRAAASAVALTSNTAANVTATALTLTPGVWDLSGFIGVNGSATAVTQIFSGISTTSATLGSQDNSSIVDGASRNLTSSDFQATIPTYRVTISSSTTYYLVARVIFSGGGNGANAFGRIQATRVA